jgi:hypothetical protein
MAEEITHNRCRLISATPELVFVVCPKGRHYATAKGESAISDAKILTSMYWDEVEMFGSAIYPEDLDNLRKLRESC